MNSKFIRRILMLLKNSMIASTRPGTPAGSPSMIGKVLSAVGLEASSTTKKKGAEAASVPFSTLAHNASITGTFPQEIG
jgi:hypothetical protein